MSTPTLSARAITETASCMWLWITDGAEPPRHLVELLHGRSSTGLEGAMTVWAAIHDGHLRYTDQGVGTTLQMASFAGLCYELRRLDVLHAVIEAGKPAWLQSPELETPSAWMRELSTVWWGGKETYHTSLFDLAARTLLPNAAEAMALMAEFDPEHIDIDLLADTYPAGRALFNEARMALAIRRAGRADGQASTKVPAAAEDLATPQRRRASL